MTFLQIKRKKGYIKYYFCGILIYKRKDIFYDLINSFKLNSHFNCIEFDRKTAEIIDELFYNKNFNANKINDTHIAFLATEFYDMGGHTEWAKNIIRSIHDKYKIKTFLTNYKQSLKNAPIKIKEIEKYCTIKGVNKDTCNSTVTEMEVLFNAINQFSPKVVFVFIHMNDFFANGLLYLLKKYTNIKLVFCNHGSHWPVLGTLFSDAVTSALPITTYIDRKYRGIQKNIKLNLCDDFEKDIVNITSNQVSSIRKKLGIADENYFTLTGCSAYKIFEDDKSRYFEMIKRLLEKEEKLQHVIITRLNKKQRQIFNNIFSDSTVKNRIKIIDFTPEYYKIFQACDLFIDSFPIASALTHIELMKHKKVSVIKINSENALHSFHEYFPENYPYMTDNIQQMEDFILQLLHNPKEREKISNILYLHYINTFEATVVRNQCINIINNANKLNKLFIQLDPSVHYNTEIIE